MNRALAMLCCVLLVPGALPAGEAFGIREGSVTALHYEHRAPGAARRRRRIPVAAATTTAAMTTTAAAAGTAANSMAWCANFAPARVMCCEMYLNSSAHIGQSWGDLSCASQRRWGTLGCDNETDRLRAARAAQMKSVSQSGAPHRVPGSADTACLARRRRGVVQERTTTNAAGDRVTTWTRWHYNKNTPTGQFGNSFLNMLKRVGMTAASGKGGGSTWESQHWVEWKHLDQWPTATPLQMFPVKYVFGREPPPSPALAQYCFAGRSTYKDSWVCALLLGEDTIAEAFAQSLKMWITLSGGTQPATAGEDETVIHFRCGDVLSGIHNPLYGVPDLAWYAAQVPHSAKRVLIVGNFESSQSTANHRATDRRGDGRCKHLKRMLPEFITAKTGKPTTVVDNGSAILDFIMLATAPFMIGSVSTFSLAAAAVNGKGKSVLPACQLFFTYAGAMKAVGFKRLSFVPFYHGLQSRSPLLVAGKDSAAAIHALTHAEGSWCGFPSVDC